MSTPRERLAEQLKQARIDAGYTTHTALARELHCVRPVVGKAENPRNPPPSVDTVTKWAKACKVDAGPLIDLVERCRSGNPEWFVPYVRAEGQASSVRVWGPLLVPGQVQTEDYARAVLRIGGNTGARLEELVTARMERQKIIGRARITVAIDHSVLLRPLGGPAVMEAQCDRLVQLAEDQLVRVHVVPYGTHVGLSGAYDIAFGAEDVTTNVNGLRDVSTTDTSMADEALSSFESILASALPPAESIEYVRTQRDAWRERHERD